MIRNIRLISLIAVLVTVVAFNVVVPTTALASDLPCYDLWAGCTAGGGSENFCEGMWCACMFETYGYICNAQVT